MGHQGAPGEAGEEGPTGNVRSNFFQQSLFVVF